LVVSRAAEKPLGIDVGAERYGPSQESFVFAAMLGVIAFVLHRLKIFVRL